MKTSQQLKLRSVALILAFALFILWRRFSPSETNNRHLRPNSDAYMILCACEMYRINNGFYPTTEQGLLALVQEPHTKPKPGKWTALVDRVPVDPWGMEYRYGCDDPYSHDRKSIRIISVGKDRTFATEDDLVLPIDPPPLSFRERLSLWFQ
jgi:general secretion pathway protein G